jgi:adenylate cyclase
VFGAPLPSRDHAAQALAAAAEIVAAVGPERVGVGLASGPVVSGTVGSGRRLEYAAIGDTTNVAARIQVLTREVNRAIVLTAATRKRLGAAALDGLQDLGEFKLRGREEPIALWASGDPVEAVDPVSPT